MSGGPEVRQQLAEALDEHFTRHFTPSNGRIAIRCGCGWKGTDWVHVDDAAREHREHIADALLAHVERIAAERAAEALLTVAHEIGARFGWAGGYGNQLRARAEAMVTGRQEHP